VFLGKAQRGVLAMDHATGNSTGWVNASFSRGLNGKTPLASELCADRVAELRSQTIGSLSRGDYSSAQTSFDAIGTVRQDQHKERIGQEKKRQSGEKIHLEKAYAIEKERFAAEWAVKLEAVDKRCEQKLLELAETHEVQRADLETELAKKLAQHRYKKSSTLLSLEDTERRLGLANEFKQAAEVGSRAAAQRKIEQDAFEARRRQIESRPRSDLATAQASEQRILDQKCHGMRVEVKREKEQAAEVLRQRYRNLEADLTHAHAIEVDLPAEVGTICISQPSRSSASSTFYGTLKFESLAGTKFDCPDVTSMNDGIGDADCWHYVPPRVPEPPPPPPPPPPPEEEDLEY